MTSGGIRAHQPRRQPNPRRAPNDPCRAMGQPIWVEMRAVATYSLDVRTAELLRIEYRLLPADAKRIVNKLNATFEGGALERAALAHNNNLANDLNADSQGGPGPPAVRTPSAHQAAVAAAAAASAATVAAGAARERKRRGDARGAVRRNTVHRRANPRSSNKSRRVCGERGAGRGHPRRGRGGARRGRRGGGRRGREPSSGGGRRSS